MGMTIQWKAQRLDEGEEPDLRIAECLVEIEGRIEIDGQPAGELAGFYLWSDVPDQAFFDLWDLDGATYGVFEEIIDHGRDRFREPLPRLLESASGILGIHYVAMSPPFRRRGLGSKPSAKSSKRGLTRASEPCCSTPTRCSTARAATTTSTTKCETCRGTPLPRTWHA